MTSFESKIGYELPNRYRDFLGRYNGGYLLSCRIEYDIEYEDVSVTPGISCLEELHVLAERSLLDNPPYANLDDVDDDEGDYDELRLVKAPSGYVMLRIGSTINGSYLYVLIKSDDKDVATDSIFLLPVDGPLHLVAESIDEFFGLLSLED